MPKYIQRPPCPKCGMKMIAATPIKDSKQTVECLRCAHQETRRVEIAGMPKLSVG